jgi:hypothetical protein
MNNKDAVEAPDSQQQSLTPEELLQAIQQLASRAPVVDPVVDSSQRQRRKLVLVDQELVRASMSAMHATAEVQAALGRTDADVTADSTAAMTWSVAIDAARKFVASLDETNGRRLQAVGLTSLQTYYICRQLAKSSKHSQTLAPHIAEMKRVIARGRRKQQQPPQQPVPAPQVPEPASQQHIQ